MCDYTQIEYCCQHFRFLVQSWCSKYERTNKPCAPNVTHLEIRNNEICCMLTQTQPPKLWSGPAMKPRTSQGKQGRGPRIWNDGSHDANTCGLRAKADERALADCRPRSAPAWERMVRRSDRSTTYD
ncbi:hypothetical protein GGR56DRAFT_614376 [Xylariaceae sp. FL0804]|nr:hypothetical protein GGR56DRAFT_614376 [Xylariaceae sp. FL0804]